MISPSRVDFKNVLILPSEAPLGKDFSLLRMRRIRYHFLLSRNGMAILKSPLSLAFSHTAPLCSPSMFTFTQSKE